MTEFQDIERYCCICGAVTVEEGSASSKAVEREGKAYCRECFRREFPDECEAHPGSKLTARCFVCNSMCCENCVIEIAGKLVCSRCKGWALERMEHGLPLITPEVPPWKDWDRFEVSEELAKPRLSLVRIAVTVVGAVLIGMLFLTDAVNDKADTNTIAGLVALGPYGLFLYLSSWHLRRKHYLLRAVWANMHSITTETFSGRISGARWREVSGVLIRSDVETEKVDSIVVYGMDSSTVVRGPFTRFWEIASAVRHICEDRGIQCEEVRRPTLLHSLLGSFPQFHSRTDDVLYDQTREASGCITSIFVAGIVGGIPFLSAVIAVIVGKYEFIAIVSMVAMYVAVFVAWSRFIYAPEHRLWLSRSSVRLSIPRSRHKSALQWRDVTEVRLELWPEDRNDRRIMVNAREDYIEIPGNMPKFAEITELIRDICRKRGIKYIEEKE